MLISEKWLREWANPTLETSQLAHQITMAGLEVDGVEPAAPEFSGVIVAEVNATHPHPNADSLVVCEVDDGTEVHQVVCGAPNVRAGLKVPFARVGAVLPGNFKIKKAKLRGEQSFGMLCGASEIGLEDQIDGLLELPADAPVGEDIREYLSLNDTVIDVDLTPNRADCLSIRGVAREVAALNDLTLPLRQQEPVKPSIEQALPVTLQAASGCPKYLGRVISEIDLAAQTPLWMVEKLRRGGVRSVDIIVDITNYVLLELGQPLHAFDHTKLDGGIEVRFANDGEKLTLLNDQEVTLKPDTLVIADQNKAVALAGIMGGKETAVSANTRTIFLECAYFAPLTLAGQARVYGLHTDASHRYERGVDWQLQEDAIERATQLIVELAGGKAGPVTVAIESTQLPTLPTVSLSAKRANQLLALALSNDAIAAMMESLGFTVVVTGEGVWDITAPSWRFDIEREEDLIEEVARLYGYDKLPDCLPAATEQPSIHLEKLLPLRRQKDLLVDRGYQEMIAYSFVDPSIQDVFTPDQKGLELVNPISQELSVMRTSLLPGLVMAARYNFNRQVDALRLFETGQRFVHRNGKLVQEDMIAGLCHGPADYRQWQGKPRRTDFYDLKGDVEALLELTGEMGVYHFEAVSHAGFHPGQSAALYRKDELVGYLGRIHPALADKLDVNANVYLFELRQAALTGRRLPAFKALSDQPAVRRDLAFSLSQEISAADVTRIMTAEAPDILQSVDIFDVYQGDKLPQGQKSLAMSLVFQDAKRTLEELEINECIDRMVLVLKQEFNAELRK